MHAKVGTLPILHCYTNNTCPSWVDSCYTLGKLQQPAEPKDCGSSRIEQVNMAFNKTFDNSDRAEDLPDGLASCFGVGGCGGGGTIPRRSDSLPSPTGRCAGFFAEQVPPLSADERPQQPEHDPVLFELTKVPPEDLAKELTLIFLREFRAIQPDELTSVAWSRRDKLTRAPNVVRFTLLFNRTNFWAQRCILDTRALSNRAAVLAHFVKIGRRLLELQNLHAAFAVVAALQSQPIYRLRRTWALLSRKCSDAFQRMADLFSGEDNHDRLRRFLQDAKLPVIPYLGLYMNDLVYIDTCYPSTGGLDSQSRKDQMNNICRIISENQLSVYNFQSKDRIRRYLESQSYLEEMQSLVEAANYSLSLELEPKQGSDSQLVGGGGSRGRAGSPEGNVAAAVSAESKPGYCNGGHGHLALPLSGNHLLPPDHPAAVSASGGVRLRLAAPDCGGSGGGGDRRTANQLGHRKSKSVGDAELSSDLELQAAAMGNAVCNGAAVAAACCSAAPDDPRRLGAAAAVQRNCTIYRPNGLDLRRNLIDDSLPVSTGDCSSLSQSTATPARLRSEASSPAPLTVPAANGGADLSAHAGAAANNGLPGAPASAGAAKPNSFHNGGVVPVTPAASGPSSRGPLAPSLSARPEPLCQGPLDRKSIYKRGKRQPRSRYRRYWAELVLTGSGRPELLLYAPWHRLLAGAALQRRHFKTACKHAQPLANDVTVVTPDRGDPRVFQINFDGDVGDVAAASNGRQRASSTVCGGQKFSAYKYRACAGAPARDRWQATIRQAVDMCRQEKSLIDFNDVAPVSEAATLAAGGTTATSSQSGSVEWTCL